MSRIDVLGGGFRPDPRSRFDGAALLLSPVAASGNGLVRHRPGQITRFRVRDGAWARFFDDAGDWTRAMAFAGLAGGPAILANAAPNFFFGQKSAVTWANALIGAAAATAAIKSTRHVRFEVRFADGAALVARVEERALMVRLPRIYEAIYKQR